MKIYIEEMTKDEFKERLDSGALVVLPLGSIEEHGPHLPLATDCFQPKFVAKRLAEKMSCMVAPFIYYGNCGSTAPFTGSVSVSFDSLRFYVRDILSSFLMQGAKNVLVMSGHAGRMHMAALKLAAAEAWDDAGRPSARIFVLSDYDFAYDYIGRDDIPDWDGHAGTIETSRMLEIRSDLVGDLPEDWKAEFDRFSVIYDSKEIIPHGFWGAPKKASAELGREVDDHILDALVEYLKKSMLS